ncbi:MAG: glycosyltransferase family 39 protein [Candidatus Omnitrophota bacterium]|jgi:4-amino-4-deoxy-L-arabinose transferase-like glycosyltransferase
MPRDKRNRLFFSVLVIAVMIKLSLFAFTATTIPQSKIQPDSDSYIKTAAMLASKGLFASQDGEGVLKYESFRTPGYPVFLATLNGIMKIPFNGIILIQIAMTILTAFIVYRTALEIDHKIALLSAVIILLDPPITIFSMMILTETLFLFLTALFMLFFTLYLKRRRIVFIALSALTLAFAVYVRPIGYYLGFAIALFMIYVNRKKGLRKASYHAFIFVLIVYSLIGAWQVRNYIRCDNIAFSSLERSNFAGIGLLKSYARNNDPYTKGLNPPAYYANVSFRCLMSLMTRPGNLKYFRSDLLTIVGKILAYPWMVFWITGFIWGAAKIRQNVYYQFIFFAALYFIIISICGAMWTVGERFRVPIMPFIAIISAYGWSSLRALKIIKKAG